ncbi:MAG TPA: methyltransferase domain-containing protein [Longimicrobiales bacterium]
MSCNCGLSEIFTERVSKHDARKFRRRGLDVRARRLLNAIDRAVRLKNKSTLEIGIGTGGLTVEMLKRGAKSAVGVDAINNQLQQAHLLALEAGVSDRLALKQGDATELSEQLPPSDVVVLDRVVCCYPDMVALLHTASTHARGAVAMSYPRAAWYTRLWVKSANVGMAVLRRTFRLYLHSPPAMHALLRQHGFLPRVVGHRGVWELLIAARA